MGFEEWNCLRSRHRVAFFYAIVSVVHHHARASLPADPSKIEDYPPNLLFTLSIHFLSLGFFAIESVPTYDIRVSVLDSVITPTSRLERASRNGPVPTHRDSFSFAFSNTTARASSKPRPSPKCLRHPHYTPLNHNPNNDRYVYLFNF